MPERDLHRDRFRALVEAHAEALRLYRRDGAISLDVVRAIHQEAELLGPDPSWLSDPANEPEMRRLWDEWIGPGGNFERGQSEVVR